MKFSSSKRKSHNLSILFLVAVTVIWGAAGPVIKYTLSYIPPFTFLFLRFLVASVIVLPFLIFEERKNPITREDLKSLIVLSFIGGTLTLSFTFFGFKYTTALDGTLISSVSPIFVLLASSKFLKEKISKGEEKGVIFGLIGTLIITLQPILEVGLGSSGRGLSQLLGNLLIIFSIVCWTIYTIWSKKVLDHVPSRLGFLFHTLHLRSSSRNYSPFFLTALLSVVSLITLAPLSLAEIVVIKGGISTPSVSRAVANVGEVYKLPEVSSDYVIPLLGVLYMAIFSTLVAYGMYEWAIKVIPVSESAIFSYLTPIFAIPFSYLLLGERVTPWFVLGGIFIGYGVYVSERKPG